MKNMKYSMAFGIALVCVMLFTACNNFFEPPESNTQFESGYGRISLSLTVGEAAPHTARTVFPSTAFNQYVYTFSKAGEQNGMVKIPDDNDFFILEVGSYTVEVQAYTGDEEPYTLAATGVSAEFSVGPGDNDPVEVILVDLDIGKEGVFSYTITWPEDAETVITLRQWPGLNDIDLFPDELAEGNGITETLELEAGSYLLTILISKDGLYAGISEAVHIYSAVVTEYIKDFYDEDMFTSIPPTVNDYTISGIGTFIYDGITARTVSVTRKETASTGAVTVFYNETETPPVNAGIYAVTFNVEATRGWSAANRLPAGTITINKLPGGAVSAPTLDSATQNSITINPVDPPSNGQGVEYGINTSYIAPSTWQAGPSFSGLSGGVYYIFARSTESDNYTAGAASGSLQVIIVTTTAQWSNALTVIRNGGSGTSGNLKTTYTIMVFGNVSVPGSTAIGTSFGSVTYVGVTLKGTGTLSLSSSGSILCLGNYQNLIIDDDNLILQGYSSNNNAVVYVQSGGVLELTNGAISDNTNISNSSIYGGGVYVASNGTFTMNGGKISNNTATSSSDSYSYGGGVYVAAGGTFEMNDMGKSPIIPPLPTVAECTETLL